MENVSRSIHHLQDAVAEHKREHHYHQSHHHGNTHGIGYVDAHLMVVFRTERLRHRYGEACTGSVAESHYEKDDRQRFDSSFIQSLGANYVETFDKSEDITILGEPLLYPELYKILEMYNPTTGARPFMPQMIMKIDASLPKLPKYYDRFNLNLEGIENKL